MQQVGGRRDLAGGAEGPAPLDELREAISVDLLRADVEDVAAASIRDRPAVGSHGVQRLPKARDVSLERVESRVGRLVRPQLVDEARSRHHLVRVEREDREQCALPAPADGDGAFAVQNVEWSEKANLQHTRLLRDSSPIYAPTSDLQAAASCSPAPAAITGQ